MKHRISARAVVLSGDGRLLLVRSRPDGSWYSLGGAVRDGESMAEALEREAFEEAGLSVALDRLLMVSESLSRSTGRIALSFWFLCTTQDPIRPGWHDPEGKVSESRFFSRDEVLTLPTQPAWMDDLWERIRGPAVQTFRHEEFDVFPWESQ